MIVYLAGPIFGQTDTLCRDWRRVATAALTSAGHEVLDPMRRDYRGNESENVTAIVEGDVRDIETSDAVLVMATAPSWGTAMEIVYAYTFGKRIVAVVGGGAVSPWLRYHATTTVETLQDGIEEASA